MTGYESLFDELNVLFNRKVEEYIKKTSQEDEDLYDDYDGYLFMIQDSQDEFTDEMLSFFSEAFHKVYQVAVDDVCEELGFQPFSIDSQAEDSLIMQPVDGKTYVDRVREYALAGEIDRLRVVLNTESHRVYNMTGQQTAEDANSDDIPIYKHWITMRDPKVRETHEYIDSVSLPIEERFYTFDGDSALYPSGFSNPENNINCRCWLTYGYS